ncbi:SusD/RagB family nutrient-binding outer membrane lipoprotein [uncultured Chitinophaga sp.]|uniref:SusD/RagB family nutrient-binding outer membrane lipoprotein n=1 Tax=uncultured Chitinophaga sp. TaxID=339340 RepID=UPI0025D3C85D|nr:SusD/RagB family nutrient-binding outer membrane lipoprotein [uncultured Chitinophaga sp.]
MHKSYKHIFLAASLASGLSLAGCKKGWIDINYDPQQITETNATPDIILPNLLIEAHSSSEQWVMQSWMGYWACANLPSGIKHTTYFPVDEQLFVSMTPDVSIMRFEANAKVHDQPFYEGIAKILKAISWSRAVDCVNNIPYTQAGKPEYRKPKYDNGQEIYEDLIKQLDQAITLIKGTTTDKALRIGVADIVFHGDRTMWVKFANTLKLRLLMHQASRTDRHAYIKTEIDKITAEGSGFLASGEDADMNPGYTDQKPSQYFSQWSQYDLYPRWSSNLGGSFLPYWQFATANEYAMNLLKVNNDPRLGYFYGPARITMPAGGAEAFPQAGPREYRGARFGLKINVVQFPYNQTEYLSQVGGVRAQNMAVSPTSTGIIKGYDMPVWMMTSIESLFLQAEAVQRGWLAGDAETAYKDAIKESFRWLNVGGNSTVPSLSDDKFNTWYIQETAAGNQSVSWTAAPDKYKLLMFQKYMAFNGIEPFETWVDYRRNGYPNLPLSYDDARTADRMPIRAPYPYSEALLNKENLEAQGTIDPFTSKIWWMP